MKWYYSENDMWVNYFEMMCIALVAQVASASAKGKSARIKMIR